MDLAVTSLVCSFFFLLLWNEWTSQGSEAGQGTAFSWDSNWLKLVRVTYELQLELQKGLSFDGWGTDTHPFRRWETKKLLVLIAIDCQPGNEPHEANAEETTQQTDRRNLGLWCHFWASGSIYPDVWTFPLLFSRFQQDVLKFPTESSFKNFLGPCILQASCPPLRYPHTPAESISVDGASMLALLRNRPAECSLHTPWTWAASVASLVESAPVLFL